MDPDNFKKAWDSQASQVRLTIDADLLLKEVGRNQKYFTAMIFWRDCREIGVCLLMAPLWIYLGMKHDLSWTWYLVVPAVLWIAGYMFVDRMRHKRLPPELCEPLRDCVKRSLAQVDHQIWLLRNVFWWYLLPLAVSVLAFFGPMAWHGRSGGWAAALGPLGMVVFAGIVFGGIYWLNQFAIRAELEPRRRELESLLASLQDE